MHKKQNRDPNRSTQTTANHLQKKPNTHHNISLNTISSTQQCLPTSKQHNKNSQILAQIKHSKNIIHSKHQKQPQLKQSLSTTRNNYKPRFILKDLMQEKEVESQESQSRCEDYFIEHQQEATNMSNTFNNSPLASEAYYRFNGRQVKAQNNMHQELQGRNKSVVLSKRSCLELQSKRLEDHESTRQYDLPLQGKAHMKVPKRTEESQDNEETVPEFYEQASTVQYSHNYAKKPFLQPSMPLSFQARIRSVSTSQPSHNPKSPKNYKLSYLQTKKQLQIRQAYFSEAMELCRHIIGGMREALEDEFRETESERVMWCYERCQEMMGVFGEWKKQ